MNRLFKKSCAWLLVLTLLVSLFALTASAAGSTKVPTVYLGGYGGQILADRTDYQSEQLFPANIPEDFASTVVDRIKVPLLKGATLNQWDDFHREVIDLTVGIYGSFALDNNGEASDGSGHPAYEHTYPLAENKADSYDLYSYWFEYDWRLDPFENAKLLSEYIDAVCAATGHEKVNLIGRCLGVNVILAYVQTYGYDKVDQLVCSAAGFDGFESIGPLFSGDMDFDPDAIPDYLDNVGRMQLVGPDGNPTFDLVITLLEVLNAAKTLNIVESVFDHYLLPEFKQYILPEVMRKSFATLPGFWSFIGEEHYEEAKKVIFGGYEDQYAGIIKKADRYHYNVMLKAKELILNGIEAGVETYIIAKYGSRMVPIIKEAETQSDSTVFTSNSSLGATTAPLYGAFSDEFVRGVMTANGGKYLSPDRQIDASTCLLPDHTWFIKNVYHQNTPSAIETMVAEILNYDGYTTVFDLEQYPQYLDYDRETGALSPLPQDAPASKAPKYSFFQKLVELFRLIINLLKNR